MMSLMTCPFCSSGCHRYTRLCRQTQVTSLGQILIVLNRWDATAVSGIHPFEITDVFRGRLITWRNLSLLFRGTRSKSVICGRKEYAEGLLPADQIRSVWCRTHCT